MRATMPDDRPRPRPRPRRRRPVPGAAPDFVAPVVETARTDPLARVRVAAERIRSATVERDEAIRAAMAARVPRAAIAEAAGLGPARLYQIRDAV